MAEKKVLKFNHSNIVSDKKKRKKPSDKIDEGFNTMTKELRNRLILRNKELSKQTPKVEHSITSEINNFDNAIKFLERIREKKKKKEKRKHKTTVKCHTNQFSPISQTTNNIKTDPPCGVLKNGKKPLWRDFHKTRKKKLTLENDELSTSQIEIVDLNTEKKSPIVEEKPPVIEEKPPVVEEKPPVVEEKPPVVEEKSIIKIPEVQTNTPILETPTQKKTKVVLGKKKSKLKFLLKTKKNKRKSNRYTRKNVLKTAGLIKESTNAPDDVLEIMYESIVNDDDETICNLKENKE